MSFANSVVLVTGGAGSIGSNLVERLLKQKAEVIIVDDLSSGFKDNIPRTKGVQFVKGDITSDDILKRAFSSSLSYVFHLAANFANQNSIEHPVRDLNTNILGTLKLLEYSRRLKNLKRFIYVSSSCVYGHTNAIIKEERKPNPDTPYAISKLTGEFYTRFYHKHYSLPTTILRYFNSYGPGERPGEYRNVIPNFFKLAMNGLPLPITGTGEERRTFTFITDIIDGTLRAAIKDGAIGECFNISSANEIKIKSLAEKINSLTRNQAGTKNVGRRKWDSVKWRYANCEKAKRILGYRPIVGIDEGLSHTYTWLLQLKKSGKI